MAATYERRTVSHVICIDWAIGKVQGVPEDCCRITKRMGCGVGVA